MAACNGPALPKNAAAPAGEGQGGNSIAASGLETLDNQHTDGRKSSSNCDADHNIAIAEIAKNSRETLRVGLSNFKGRDLLSLRVWYRESSGEMRPGNAGLALGIEKLPALREALAKTETEARSRGLLK